VQLEQLQSTHVHAENLTTPAFGVPVPHLNQSVEQGTRKVAIVQPHTNVADGVVTAAVSAELLVRSDSTQESEKSTGGPLTPLPGHNSSATGPGLIDPDLSLITLDEEPVGLDECSNRTCVSGGLHMADHKSMVAFARKVNRLRYHSHCIAGSDFQTSLGPSPGTSPSSTSSSSVINARSRFMKRSMSCPDIKKPIIEDKDGKTPKLPEVSEVNSGLEDKADGASAEVEQENAPKEPEHPYEHLFQKILPSVMSPLESRTLPSPHLLLDLCLMKAANLHPPKSKSEEINVLKGHIELLHGQLLFERHRREAHAHRNRRLALKCRKTVTLEEQNNTMGQKIHNLEKEIASLKKEVTIQRNVGLVKERELLNTIEGLEGKLERHKKDISILIQDKSHLESKFSLLQEEFSILQKESDQKKADFFSLENEVKNCQKYIERNKELKTAYEARLKEILVLGELLRRYKEITTPPSECGYLVEQMEACRQTHDEEIRGLRTLLETVMSQQEASNGTISDLKKRLEKREAIIELQRKDMQEKEQEHHLQLHALETKYESIKATNNRLELEILSLQHQISLKTVNTRPTRGRITSSSPSNNGEVSPAGNSNHSDVDSAASAGGFQMSPERNMCIFGSPQFDPPSEEMKDLQAVLDKEYAGAIAAASSRRRNSSPLTHSRGDRI
ncbi:Hamartin, partial [Orchesella cincta]